MGPTVLLGSLEEYLLFLDMARGIVVGQVPVGHDAVLLGLDPGLSAVVAASNDGRPPSPPFSLPF